MLDLRSNYADNTFQEKSSMASSEIAYNKVIFIHCHLLIQSFLENIEDGL